MEVNEIIFEAFNATIGVLICSRKKFEQWIKKTGNRKYKAPATCGGCVFVPKQKEYKLFIWLRQYDYGADFGVIAHESNHATYSLFELIGERDINPDSEIYCMTLQCIVQHCLEFNNKWFPYGDIQQVMSMFMTINEHGSKTQNNQAANIWFGACFSLKLSKRKKGLIELWELYSEVENSRKKD